MINQMIQKKTSNRKDLIGLQSWFSYLTVVQTLQCLHYALLGFLCLQKQKITITISWLHAWNFLPVILYCPQYFFLQRRIHRQVDSAYGRVKSLHHQSSNNVFDIITFRSSQVSFIQLTILWRGFVTSLPINLLELFISTPWSKCHSNQNGY